MFPAVGVKIIFKILDKTLRLWDLTNYTTKALLSGHTKDVLSVAFSQDNRMIISGGMDKRMILWNIKGEEKFRSEDFDGWVSSIGHITQDKNPTLAVGSWDSKVRFFDQEVNKTKSIDALDYGVVKIDSDDEGEFLFVGQKNGSVKIWNLAADGQTDTLKQTIDSGSDLYDISYEPKYFHVISLATADGLQIKEIKNSQNEGLNFKYKNAACLSLAWDAKKNYLFAGFTDGVIRVYKFSQ